jgi:hypothetical protein
MPERRPMGSSWELVREVREHDSTSTPSHEEIARLAYTLWETRGSGEGSAEQDWFEAERQLTQSTAQSQAA